jgi:hypothetical protein
MSEISRSRHKTILIFFSFILPIKHIYIQLNPGAQGAPKSTTANIIQKRIGTLNERYNKKEIDVEELLNGLSLLVAKRT